MYTGFDRFINCLDLELWINWLFRLDKMSHYEVVSTNDSVDYLVRETVIAPGAPWDTLCNSTVTIYSGSGTVWHRIGDGKRADASTEAQLSDCLWKRQRDQRDNHLTWRKWNDS